MKIPSLRPIGVGEALRGIMGNGEALRGIMGKAMNWILKEDIQESAGSLQTATGWKSGAESAIHSVRLIFEDSSTDAVILVDAHNAFSSITRKGALHNKRKTFV